VTPGNLENRLIDFSVLICHIASLLPNTGLGSHIERQIIRSGTSPACNYAEARSAESRQDFIHKLKIVLKELRETRVWLINSHRMQLLPPTEVEPAIRESDELISIFITSVNTAVRRLKPNRRSEF